MKRRWVIGERDCDLENHLSRGLNIPPLVSRILINRGIQDTTSAKEFLNISPSNLIDPFLLNDMEKAVSRLIKAIHDKDRILIYGDYDVDGVTASSLYLEFFRRCGIEAGLYIPDRIREGYSLNESAVMMARSGNIDIILTADCGTSSTGPIKLAQDSGIDVIVTDHHEPPSELPEAYALINPGRCDSTYPFKGLTGVGVAFKLVQAITTAMNGHGCMDAFLDLVALGTVADVAPLTGENRYLVKRGLELLTEGRRVGIKALKEVAGIKKGDVTVGTVGFMLGPRINASGRLSSAEAAVKLLTTSDYGEAIHIAGYLDRINQERQRLELKIKNEVRTRILNEMDIENENVIVMASKDWHQGVIGIVASKIVEEFYRPCVLISLQEDGTGKGSARSIPGFNIFKGLEGCNDLLDRYGGHKYAAGLTIKGNNIPLLRDRLSSIAGDNLGEEDLVPRIIMDAEIDLEDINFPLLKEMALLPPYGISNPEPMIVTRGLVVTEPRILKGDHLKMRLRKGRASFDSIGFSMGASHNGIINKSEKIDIAYTPELNLWNGTYGIQLKLKDIKASEEVN